MTRQSAHPINELTLTRLYDASVQQVWDAWVEPNQVGQWWGPRGFAISTVRKEVRTGGDWLYTMHGPDGVDYPNHTRFLEVEPLKRLVYDHGGFEDRPPMFRVSVYFTELNGKTKMEMTMTFPTAEATSEARIFIKKAQGETTWDRLAEFLEKQISAKEVFVINRSFDVDIQTVYEVWTNPKHIMNWMAPTGFTGQYLSADIRPGGESFYAMTGNGLTMYGKAKYIEMTEPTHIVYTQRFVDKDGKTSRHPMAPTWPEIMKTTVTFCEEGPRQTRVTLEWEVFGEATEVERDTFKNAKAGMTQGWTGSFDKLDEYLKR
jgi:uncharacterized protein YndB with AHSA1/START domain